MAQALVSAGPLDPLGVDLSALDSKKKRLLAQLAATMGRKSPLIDTGAIKLANWGEILGDAVKNYRLNDQLDSLEGEEKALAEKMQERRAKGFDALAAAEAPAVRESAGPPTAEGEFPPSFQKTRDETLRELANLYAYPDPAVSAAAMKRAGDIREQYGKERVAVIGNAQKVGPGTRADFGVDAAPETHFSGTDVVMSRDPNTGIVTRTNLNKPGELLPATLDRPAGQFKEDGTFVPAGQGQLGTQVAQHFGKEKIDELVKGREDAQKAIEGGQIIADMMAQTQEIPPQYFGPAAPIQQFVNQLNGIFGLKIDTNAVKAERLASLAGERMIERIRMLAPVTDDDVNRMQSIVGSPRGNTKEGLQEVLQIAMQATARKLERHNRSVRDLVEAKDANGNPLPGYDLARTMYVGNMPHSDPSYTPDGFRFIGTKSSLPSSEVGAKSPAQMSDEELLRALGGR